MAVSGPTKKQGITAVIGGAIVVVIAVLANITTIADFIKPLFGDHTTPPPSPPHIVTRVCMGNGGGDNCLSGANAHFDCDHYTAMGGGGQKTYDTLADQFCGYSDNGVHKVYPHSVTPYQDNGGGQCGWTGFTVTCN